ncbi:MAG: hypothetical protein NC483_05660 [Ruminococcus sp.]|nr:hypothetical protein [Ruminococcus sp.]
MKFERNRNSKKYFWCGLILVVVLTVTLTFIGSKANYRMTASIPLTEGKVVSSPYDINIVAMYIDGVEQDKDTTMPDANYYAINEEKSYCYKSTKEIKDDRVKLYTSIYDEHVIENLSKSDKCYLYFDKIQSNSNARTMEELIADYYVHKKYRLSSRKDFNVPIENELRKTLYVGNDEDGTTYYFAGNPLDNWVEFGGYYWRIIRINGNGSTRMIYQGRTQDESGKKLEPQTSGTETQIGTSAFSEKIDDNAYVGFMYGTPGSDTYEATHENKNNSTVKQYLDNWFINSNIKQGTSYFDKIDLNAGFCNDKRLSSNDVGTGKNATSYIGNYRLGNNVWVTSATDAVTPTFNCKEEDLFTYKSANKGNKKLQNPVGLIIADEAVYAGFGYLTMPKGTNYLRTSLDYWVMTPASYAVSDVTNCASVYRVTSYLTTACTMAKLGVRPVINLRSDVTFTGDGTISNPYKVV